ncbi:MAG: hypothetical protein ACOCTI_06150 [Phycisphaeraceae bacterium]
MRFLLLAYRRHPRRLRAEQIFLLLVRCLIVLVLGLALAGTTFTASTTRRRRCCSPAGITGPTGSPASAASWWRTRARRASGTRATASPTPRR